MKEALHTYKQKNGQTDVVTALILILKEVIIVTELM